jgi:hypothetical protein
VNRDEPGFLEGMSVQTMRNDILATAAWHDRQDLPEVAAQHQDFPTKGNIHGIHEVSQQAVHTLESLSWSLSVPVPA